MDRNEINAYMDKFAAKYGDFLAVKANIVAINRMLIKRGRGEELFKTVHDVTEKFKKKVENNTA